MAHDGDHTPTPEPGSWSAILLQEAGHLLDAVGSWRRGVAARRADRLLARYRYLQREAAPPAVPPATVAPTLPAAPAPEPDRVAAWMPARGTEPVTGWVPASAPAREPEPVEPEPEPVEPEPEAVEPEPEAVEPEPEAVEPEPEPVEPEPEPVEPGPPSAWLVRDPEAEPGPEPEPSAEQDAAPGQPSWLPPGQG
jgi:hypothetical protein